MTTTRIKEVFYDYYDSPAIEPIGRPSTGRYYPGRPAERHWYGLRDGWRWLRNTVVGLVVAAVVIVGGAATIRSYSEAQCRQYAEGYRLDYRWGFLTGCRVVLPDGRLVSIDSIRFNEQGKLEENG